jgi:hypothetical protein
MWCLYQKRLQQGWKEADIPEKLVKVQAEVIKKMSPWAICRLVSGQHQKMQQSVRRISTADVVSHFAEAALAFKKQGRSPFLSDEDIWHEIESVGIPNQMGTKQKKKHQSTLQMVCLLSRVRRLDGLPL